MMRLGLWLAALVAVTMIAGGLAPAAGGPAGGGTVVFPVVADPTFNPWHPRAFVESVFVNRVLFNGLTKPGKNLQPSPDLAERWEISPDGLTWTFFLRKGVKWHDGRDFTAEDVKFTYDIVTDAKFGASGAANFRSVKEIKIVDAHTVQFVLSAPQASLAAVASTNAGILPKHAFTGVTDPWTHDAFNKRAPIGTGAFKVRQYVPGSFVTLERNPAYFAGAPTIETVTFKVLPDVNAQVAQVLSGDLTLIFIDNPALVRAVQGRPTIEVSTVPQNNFYWLAPNLRDSKLFADRRVRQAIMHAMDRPAMIKGFLEGFATPATGPISPALAAYYKADVKTYEFDRAKARALLAEAGWQPGADGVLVKDGQRFRTTLTYPTVQYFEPLAALVQQYLRVVGIEVALDGLEFNQFISQRFIPRRFEFIAGWWITPYDPDFYNYLHSEAHRGFNVPLYSNKEADALLEAGRKATSVRERQQAYAKFQELVAEDLPYLYLWYPREIRAINRRLKGVPAIGLRDAFQYTHEWRLE